MSDDPIAATIMAKQRGPTEAAGEETRPVITRPEQIGQGIRGIAPGTPPDPLLDAVLEKLGMSPSYQLGRGDR